MTDDLLRHTMRCFDIGGSKIVSADVSVTGQIAVQSRIPTPLDSYDEFCQQIQKLCSANGEAIGVSIAAVINPHTGVVKSANIPCISGRPLACELTDSLGHPVHLINDANAFALAQARHGKARHHEVVLAIILGTGVGGGIVINGQLLTGQDGTAGEWGHGPASAVRTECLLPRHPCNCGQFGCVDTLGGARGLERLYQHIQHADLDSHTIIDAWESGDSSALRVVDVWLDIVGGALAGVVNTIGPSIVAVGGGLANNAKLIAALDTEVAERRLAGCTAALLYPAVSGPEQGLLGAALFAQRVYP